MTDTNVEIRYSSLVIKKGSDWTYAYTDHFECDDRVEMETNGRISVKDSEGRFKSMLWVGRDSDIRRKLIQARHEGHNVVVDQ